MQLKKKFLGWRSLKVNMVRKRGVELLNHEGGLWGGNVESFKEVGAFG